MRKSIKCPEVMDLLVCLSVGILAGFGLLCLLWAGFGWLLPFGKGCIVYAEKEAELTFARRYLWLRDLGLIRCPLIFADFGLRQPEREWLENNGIEICRPEEISERLGIGAEAI